MLLSDCNVWGRIHFGNLFLDKWTCESWIWNKNKHFSENGSPGQTTMLTRRASKFCVKPRSPFSEISHHDPKTIGKPPSIVSWPECQPELLGYVHFTFVSHYFHIIFTFLWNMWFLYAQYRMDVPTKQGFPSSHPFNFSFLPDSSVGSPTWVTNL